MVSGLATLKMFLCLQPAILDSLGPSSEMLHDRRPAGNGGHQCKSG
jgi:hypothetical protein